MLLAWSSQQAAYDISAMALFARMTTPPTDARKVVINTFIKALKAAGIWSKLDTLQVYAAADSQAALLDWKAPTRTATLNGAAPPTFVADRGFTGTATGYIDTGLQANLATNMTVNSIWAGIYNRVNHGASNNYEFGVRTNAGNPIGPRFRRASDLAAIGLCTTEVAGVVANTGTLGLSSMAKAAALAGEIRRNGALFENLVLGASGALPAFNMITHALNTSGTPSSFLSTGLEAALFGVGGYLTIEQEALLYTAVQAYMTAVGAQV